MDSRYMNVSQTAVYTGRTEPAVRMAVRRRTIPYIQETPGGRVMFDRLAIDKHMADHKVLTRRDAQLNSKKRSSNGKPAPPVQTDGNEDDS